MRIADHLRASWRVGKQPIGLPISPAGRIGRIGYLLCGVGLFWLKYALDSVLAIRYRYPWSFANYWPGLHGQMWTAGDETTRTLFPLLLILAVPFVWVGVCLTARRLRSAGLPIWLAIMFFVPVINAIFFAILCTIPAARKSVEVLRESSDSSRHPRVVFTEGRTAVLAPLVTTALGTALCAFDVYALGVYGFGLFVGLPCCLGMIAALILGMGGVRTATACLSTAVGSAACTAVALLVLGHEGAICLLMAAPLWLGCAALGGLIGFYLQQHTRDQREAALLIITLALVAPVIMGAERAIAPPASVFEVRTSVVVAADPQNVWERVVAFPPISPPTEWIFRAGVAFPIAATIDGRGPGAQRRCRFSTGDFVEPIQVWDSPRLLRFAVTSNPPPMQELSFYENVAPPHLHGFLESRGGQFRLTASPDGGTELEGTTWYQHEMWPASYWKLWSDYIIHRIHFRVLRHIQTLCEADTHDPPKPGHSAIVLPKGAGR